jgi:hypothetical protein
MPPVQYFGSTAGSSESLNSTPCIAVYINLCVLSFLSISVSPHAIAYVSTSWIYCWVLKTRELNQQNMGKIFFRATVATQEIIISIPFTMYKVVEVSMFKVMPMQVV